MEWITYLSDTNIMSFLDTVKSQYFIIASLCLLICTPLAKKTKNKLDDKVVGWFKKKLQ